MKKIWLLLPALILCLIMSAHVKADMPEGVPAGDAGSAQLVTADVSEKPHVYFSGYKARENQDTVTAYDRTISVSDHGNYLMTWLQIVRGEKYYFRYSPIYQGSGIQTVFTSDWNSEEIRIGKLFRFETMEECGMEIDQIISDHIGIRESEGSNFILIFRPNGGKYDGTIQTVTVVNGRRDLTSDSYDETESIEMLGVFRFPEEERSALQFGQNVIQPESSGFHIQMAVVSEESDGIALMTYTDSKGQEVYVVQPVINGYGVLTAYDNAKSVEDITVGRFGIMGYSYKYTDAMFQGIDFDFAVE